MLQNPRVRGMRKQEAGEVIARTVIGLFVILFISDLVSRSPHRDPGAVGRSHAAKGSQSAVKREGS